MVYSVITRENAVTALDTQTNLTELGGNSPGAVIVPNASKLTGVFINAAPDWTADAMYGFSCAVRLTGSAVGGNQSYPGPCGGTAGAATASAGLSEHPAQRYKTNIPVVPGQEIDVTGYMHGEDMGELHLVCSLEFDGVPGMITDMDYREENLTAANTKVVLGAKWGAAHAYIQPSTRQIGEIHVNGGLKAVAGPLGAVAEFELFGPAMPKGGEYQYVGHSYASQDDLAQTTAGSGSVQSNSVVYTIPPGKLVLGQGRFQAQAQELEDDVGTIFAIIGIGYI